jgi:hypothetical protein
VTNYPSATRSTRGLPTNRRLLRSRTPHWKCKKLRICSSIRISRRGLAVDARSRENLKMSETDAFGLRLGRC